MGRTENVQGLQQESIRDRVSHLRAKFRGKRIIVGVDRLDYIKGTLSVACVPCQNPCACVAHPAQCRAWACLAAGVPQKLHAFEVFLRKHPEFKEQVRVSCLQSPSHCTE